MHSSSTQRGPKIRIAGIHYRMTECYRLLKELRFVSYEENSPRENARKLHEQEVDVALIPASEFALHGGYVGLDFGVGCYNSSGCLTLYAHRPIDTLSTIYLYDSSSCSTVLLRVLLQERWKVAPKLLPWPNAKLPTNLADHEGFLVRSEEPNKELANYAVINDLVSVWHHMTGLPFVLALWAVRPGVLNLKQCKLLNEIFHRAALMEMSHELQHPTGYLSQHKTVASSEVPHFYLDAHMLEGLDAFYQRAARYHLLPQTRYHSATFRLLDQKTTHSLTDREIPQILERITHGERISMREGVKIVHEASLADLGLAADIARSNLSPTLENKHFLMLDDENLQHLETLESKLKISMKRGVNRVVLSLSDCAHHSLSFYSGRIKQIRSLAGVGVTGFNVAQIFALAERSKLNVSEVVAELISAGIDLFSGAGGGMLIERILEQRENTRISAQEWLETIQCIQQYGAKSSCCLSLSPHESWEERLVHLHTLRTFQDKHHGFSYFYVDLSLDEGFEPPLELKLRAVALGRLFLDNIPVCQEANAQNDTLSDILSTQFGMESVRLESFA